MTTLSEKNPAFNPNCPYCVAKAQHKSREDYTFYHPLAGHGVYDGHASYGPAEVEADRRAKEWSQRRFNERSSAH